MYFQYLINFIFLLFGLVFESTNSYYYCGDFENELCSPNKHFLCNVSVLPIGGNVLGTCPMTRKLKNFIVDQHNIFRNKLAGGEQTFKGGGKFPKAAQMREVLWDDELAYSATEHAKRCKLAHDKCHDTHRFQLTGQNIHIKFTDGKLSNINDILIRALNDWWNEAALVDDGVALANTFCDGADVHAVGHFTAMANERAAHVGCGIALCESCENYRYCALVTCNYSLTNIATKFMYKVSKRSACNCERYESQPSDVYPNLCKNTGKIFNNMD